MDLDKNWLIGPFPVLDLELDFVRLVIWWNSKTGVGNPVVQDLDLDLNFIRVG